MPSPLFEPIVLFFSLSCSDKELEIFFCCCCLEDVKQSLKTAKVQRKMRIVFNPAEMEAEIYIYFFFTETLAGSLNSNTQETTAQNQ